METPQRKRLSKNTRPIGGEVHIGPYAVGVAGEGGIVIGDDYAVAVVGLGANKTGPRSSAKSGKFGASIGPANGLSDVVTGPGGVASAGKSSTAKGAQAAFAGVNDGGQATASDGGMALARGPHGQVAVGMWGTAQCNSYSSSARAEFQGTALVQRGVAASAKYGLASVRRAGEAAAGVGGIAIAWNHVDPIPIPIVYPYGPIILIPADDHADSRLGVVSAGRGGVVIAFMEDPTTNERVPVVGFVGKAGATGARAHFGLKAGVKYRLTAEGEFREVNTPDRKWKPKT